MLYFLNSPVLTNYGKFSFSPISLEEAKDLWNNIVIDIRDRDKVLTLKFLMTALQEYTKLTIG
jgi:hypothetical protein